MDQNYTSDRTVVCDVTLTFLVLLCLLVPSMGYAQIFRLNTTAPLTGVYAGSVAWGDYDNDGNSDILLTGRDNSATDISLVYRNDGGNFTDIQAGLTGVYVSSVAWGDYDNDGDLDILLTGLDNSSTRISQIYRNDGGIFSDINAGLPGVDVSSVAWGDYDNDGDLDILLTGRDADGGTPISLIFCNDEGSFSDISAGLTGVSNSSVAWGDYDNDGDLDILLAGLNVISISQIYRNDGGVFTNINAGLMGVSSGSVAWGDYDNDGDLDVLLTGYANTTRISQIYRNNGGAFTNINAGLMGVGYSSVAWGDYDNDGDLDILLTGEGNSSPAMSLIYRNDGGVFTDIHAGLPGVKLSSVAWGDYDNDGRLDILLTGQDNTHLAQIWKNYTSVANTVPRALTDLIASGIGLTIYPNPAQESVTISLYPRHDRESSVQEQKTEAVTLRILTMMGKEVGRYESMAGGTVQIGAGSLPSGVYFVRIEPGGGRIREGEISTASFVVQR